MNVELRISILGLQNIDCFRFSTEPIKTCATHIYFKDFSKKKYCLIPISDRSYDVRPKLGCGLGKKFHMPHTNIGPIGFRHRIWTIDASCASDRLHVCLFAIASPGSRHILYTCAYAAHLLLHSCTIFYITKEHNLWQSVA